jgi:hypothetical protein
MLLLFGECLSGNCSISTLRQRVAFWAIPRAGEPLQYEKRMLMLVLCHVMNASVSYNVKVYLTHGTLC